MNPTDTPRPERTCAAPGCTRWQNVRPEHAENFEGRRYWCPDHNREDRP